MIANTKLEEIQAELAPRIETACPKGNCSSSFVYAAHNGCTVEISEHNGRFWLEFWKNSDDENFASLHQVDCESAQEAVEKAVWWLQEPGPVCWSDEAYYAGYLEIERRLFAWCLVRLGSFTPEDAADEALAQYPNEPTDAPHRDIVFHELAWEWAMRRLHGGKRGNFRPPDDTLAKQEYERKGWKLHGDLLRALKKSRFLEHFNNQRLAINEVGGGLERSMLESRR